MKREALEKQKYEEMWKHEAYRSISPGFNAAPHFFDYFKERIQVGDSIVDFGCGTGRVGALFFRKAFGFVWSI